MKLKKILASVAAFAMVATAFSSVVMAETAPVITASVADPYDFYDDGGNYVVVELSYSGFEGFSKYSRGNGVGLTSLGVTFTYDKDNLTLEEVLPNEQFGTAAVTGDASLQWAVGDANMLNAPEMSPFVTVVFSLDDSYDYNANPLEFAFTSIEFGVTTAVKNSASTVALYGNTNACTAGVAAESFALGSSTPATEYVNVTTDGNVEGIADGQVEKGSKAAVSAKEVAGKTAKLYANGEEIVSGAEYTFDADVSFTVVYEDEVVEPEYTYSVTDYGKSESLKAIFYALSIVNPDEAMTLGVAGKAFTASGLPKVDGGASVDMTYVIKGVPENILTNVPEVESLTGAKNGEYTLK